MEDPSGVSPAPMVVQLNRRFQHYQDMLTPYKVRRGGRHAVLYVSEVVLHGSPNCRAWPFGSFRGGVYLQQHSHFTFCGLT